MGKKLSDKEVGVIIEKIRRHYDNIIVTYMLDKSLKNGFEERYFQVRKAGVDPMRFINDEIKSLKEIESREKARINREAEKKVKKAVSAEGENREKKDFADRVLEDLMKKIENYPEIHIHSGANPEIRKLFGTLIEFDSKQWQYYEKLAKKYRINRYDIAYTRLENMLNNFTRIYSDDIPVRLSQYKNMLSSPYSRNKNIGKEEKLCILECAYLIKNLKDTALDLSENPEIQEREKQALLSITSYLDKIIDDFRLRDLVNLGG